MTHHIAPPPIQDPTQVISPALLRTLAQTLPMQDGEPLAWHQDRIETAVSVMQVLRPRDPFEAMLAAHVVATNAGVMDSYRRAMVPNISDSAARQHRGYAAALLRCLATTLRRLERRQANLPSQQKAPPPAEAPAPAPVQAEAFVGPTAAPAPAEAAAPLAPTSVAPTAAQGVAEGAAEESALRAAAPAPAGAATSPRPSVSPMPAQAAASPPPPARRPSDQPRLRITKAQRRAERRQRAEARNARASRPLPHPDDMPATPAPAAA